MHYTSRERMQNIVKRWLKPRTVKQETVVERQQCSKHVCAGNNYTQTTIEKLLEVELS
jgi:hypothetical protein